MLSNHGVLLPLTGFLESLGQRGVVKLKGTGLAETMNDHRTDFAAFFGAATFFLTPFWRFFAQLIHLHDAILRHVSKPNLIPRYYRGL